jgi:UPF0755 protein
VTDLLDLRDERPVPGRSQASGRGKCSRCCSCCCSSTALGSGAVTVGGGCWTGCSGLDAPDFEGRGQRRGRRADRARRHRRRRADTLLAKGVVASRRPSSTSRRRPAATACSRLLPAAAQDERRCGLRAAARPVGARRRTGDRPGGAQREQTLQLLAEGTGLPLADFQAAAADPAALGLPEYAQGNLEGFLFPATYEVEPGTTAPQVLTLMIDRFEQAAETVGLEAGAERLGRTPYEVVIVASLIEREVKFDDEYGQVARVVYNRLDQGIPLGIDAAVAFGVGKVAGEELTKSDLEQDTPYENRRRTGLPPTPIASPGEATLKGALEPVDGDILYYVLATKEGRSFFTNDYQAFLDQRDKSRAEGVF